MPAYVALQIDIHDPETYDRYKQLAPATMKPFGGKYIARGGAVETLEGDWHPSRFVMLEFPTADQARAWWSSEEYREAKALRRASASTEMILVEGLDVPLG